MQKDREGELKIRQNENYKRRLKEEQEATKKRHADIEKRGPAQIDTEEGRKIRDERLQKKVAEKVEEKK